MSFGVSPADGSAHAWRVDALVLAEHPAVDDRRAGSRFRGLLHAELDPAVVEQQRVAAAAPTPGSSAYVVDTRPGSPRSVADAMRSSSPS